jgi:hypothetical protein
MCHSPLIVAVRRPPRTEKIGARENTPKPGAGRNFGPDSPKPRHPVALAPPAALAASQRHQRHHRRQPLSGRDYERVNARLPSGRRHPQIRPLPTVHGADPAGRGGWPIGLACAHPLDTARQHAHSQKQQRYADNKSHSAEWRSTPASLTGEGHLTAGLDPRVRRSLPRGESGR